MENADARSQAGGGEDDDPHRPVRQVVGRLEEKACQDRVTLGELIGAFGETSFVPAMMVPALLVLSPLSGIPLFSSVCGITIVLIAAQMLWKRNGTWLPGFVRNREVPGRRLAAAAKRLRRVADFLDRHTHGDRLHLLVARGGRVVPQLLCVVAGVLMPVLELVPLSSSVLGGAVLCFSVGLLTRDGLFVLFGMAVLAAATMVPFLVLGGGF